MKNFQKLRFTSLLSVACSCFLTIILFAEYFILCDEQSEATCFWNSDDFEEVFLQKKFSRLASFTFDGFLTSVPIFIFGCGCYPTLFLIYAQIRNKAKVNKVIKYSLSISASFYSIAGCFAFMTFLDETCGNIFLNDFNSSPEIMI